MRILFLTQWFYPEPETKGLCFAKELAKNGHIVEVLTGFPNYPAGKIYKGYKVKLHSVENIDDVLVHRVPLFPSHDSSPVKRILNYLSFCISAMIIGLFVTKKADVIYAYHPPATIALPALLIKFIKRIPVVYDIQDLWPDTLSSTGMVNNNFIIRIVDYYCRLAYRFCDKIVVLSPGFKKKLLGRGVPEEKISVVYNWSLDLEEPSESVGNLKKKLGFNNDFIVMFAGNMGKAQKLGSVLDAALRVQKYDQNVKFVFIGDGVELEKLKLLKDSLNLNNTVFIGRVASSEIGNYLKSADVLLVHLRNDPLFEITIPSKVQAYLRIGKPILYCGNGDAAKLVVSAEAGIVCEAENSTDIMEKIMILYNLPESERIKMGHSGKNFYENELSLQMGTKKMIKLFNSAKYVH
jgi:glycosyltransferase involved in cell wall biosynthesis